MEKNNISKIVEVFAILCTAILPLEAYLENWRNVYCEDITAELWLILPILLTLSTCICVVILMVVYLILDLKSGDVLTEQIIPGVEKVKAHIYHYMNSYIIIYVVAAVIAAIIYDYSVAEKSIVWFISTAVLIIAVVCIVIFSIGLHKKDYNVKYNCWKMCKNFFPAKLSTYVVLIVILALITIMMLVVVFRAEPMQCDVHMECKSNGYIELNVDCDAEVDIQIVIDDEPVTCVIETGGVKQSYGNEERYTLDAENYYRTSYDLAGEDWTSGYHTLAVMIEEKSEVDGIKKSRVYIENKFEVSSEGEFLFVRDVIEND